MLYIFLKTRIPVLKDFNNPKDIFFTEYIVASGYEKWDKYYIYNNIRALKSDVSEFLNIDGFIQIKKENILFIQADNFKEMEIYFKEKEGK